jgi:hypothetical protein
MAKEQLTKDQTAKDQMAKEQTAKTFNKDTHGETHTEGAKGAGCK